MSPFPSLYAYSWNPTLGAVQSGNPAWQGYDNFGRWNGGAAAGPWAGFASAAPTGGYSQTPLPGMGGSTPGTFSGYNPGAQPGQGFNPYFTVSNVKSPEIQGLINTTIGDWNTLRGLNPTNVVQTALQGQNPQWQQFMQQDLGAATGYYDGTVQGELDKLRALRAGAYDNAVNRQMGDLSRVLALNRMGQGGPATLGMGSYLTKQALDSAAGLRVQQGLDDAQTAANNYNMLQQAKLGLMGQRGNLLNQDIQRQLLPSQVGANWFNTMAGGLGGLAQLQLANNFYGLGGNPSMTPAVPGYGYAQGNYAAPGTVRARLL